VASSVGTLEAQRGGSDSWQAIFVGAPVLVGDKIRTGDDAAARIVLSDDTIIDIGNGAQIKLERFVSETDPQRQRALVRLLEGKGRILLGGRESASLGRFEVETATAVASGRTGAFVMRYDTEKKFTDVVGLEGTTEVRGTLGMLEAPAEVPPQHSTRVAKGRLPAPPEKLNEEQMGAYLSGLDVIGTGNRESLDVGHPLLAGRLVRPEDRPGAAPASAAAAPSSSYLAPGVPGETFAQKRSKDLTVVTQPIPEFRAADPDLPAPR
jgi:hypothetical protein